MNKYVHIQQIRKQGKEWYNDKTITGNKQSLEKMWVKGDRIIRRSNEQRRCKMLMCCEDEAEHMNQPVIVLIAVF